MMQFCGGDCTNFVSQALYAGDWPMEEESPGQLGWYSYSAGNGQRERMSRSWAGAHPFALYLQSSRHAITCSRSQLELGDVVQHAHEGHVSHTALVTKVEWSGYMPVPKVFEDATGHSFSPVPTGKVYYVSSHTNNRQNYPLADWESGWDLSDIVYWHLFDVIPPMPRPSWRSGFGIGV
jgi:plastocyanin